MRNSLLLLAFCVSTAAFAQSTGTLNLNATVSKTAALRYDSNSVTGLGTTGANAGSPGLNFTLNFGDMAVVDTTNIAYHGGTVTLNLRSNAAYQVSAIVGASTFTNVAGDLRLADIGFGVPNTATNIRTSGVLGVKAGTTVPAAFDYDPLTAAVVNGLPVFSGTINNLAASTVVVSGSRISTAGSLATTTNALLVDTKYSILPQFFTPTAASTATVTFTISTP